MNALLLLAAEKASPLSTILPLLILAPLAYVLIVPQRKQKKKQAELMASLKVGDEVITSGGIYGTVSFLEDSIAHLAVDTDVVIRVSKGSLTIRQSTSDDDDVDITDGADVEPGDSEPSKSSKSSKS